MIPRPPPHAGRQRGFALVAAIFIVVVLALLGIMMVTIGGMQRATAAAATQGARAYHAARSGIEWGVFRALNDTATTCSLAPASTTTGFTLTGPGLDDFGVSVECSYTIHKEGNDPEFNVFVITSTATSGNFGDAEYVSRRLRITATSAPPS